MGQVRSTQRCPAGSMNPDQRAIREGFLEEVRLKLIPKERMVCVRQRKHGGML